MTDYIYALCVFVAALWLAKEPDDGRGKGQI